jgi:hypothetical protein
VLPTVRATSYVTPLREGGSLPALVEADDDGTYVVKFRGAGQGTAALVAEVVVGEIGRRLGIRVPDLVLIELDPQIARLEPDFEIQELLKNSAGLNLGMDFLPGSLMYEGISWRPPPQEAADVYWLDSFSANIDRTWRNPNVLIWHRRLWAIDHGAALIFQHAWPPVDVWAGRRYDLSEHVLAPVVARMAPGDLAGRAEKLAATVTAQMLGEVLALVPDGWLLGMNAAFGDPRSADDWRARYLEYLLARVARRQAWWTGVPA